MEVLTKKYNKVCDIIKKKENYTTKDLISFRKISKDFHIKYYIEIGLIGITNYLHIFGCRYILYYME